MRPRRNDPRVELLASCYGISEKSVRYIGVARLMRMSEEARSMMCSAVATLREKMADGIDEPSTVKQKMVRARRAAKLAPELRVEKMMILAGRRKPSMSEVAAQVAGERRRA